MFENLKKKITELAYSAVTMTEESFTHKSGAQKKEMAIEYIVSMLPIAPPLKSVAVVVLSKFIDEAVEHAVKYMNEVKNKEA